PAYKSGRVAEPLPLQMIVGDLDDQLRPHRLPARVPRARPTARSTRQPRRAGLVSGAREPRVAALGVLAERGELFGDAGALGGREPRRDADVAQDPRLIEQAEQQRTHTVAVLVPAEAADDAVGRALVLDLEHLALARQVRQRQGLRDHPVQPRPFEVTEPERRDRAILGRWRQMQRRTQLRELALEQLAPLAERAIEQR